MSPETTTHNTTPLLNVTAWGAKGLVQHLSTKVVASDTFRDTFFATTQVHVEYMYMKQPVSCGQFIVQHSIMFRS